MAIDRIGKGGAPPATPEPSGVDKKGAVQKTFEVQRGEPAKHVDAAHHVAGTSPLARLRAGEIDVNGYLDLKVDEATAGLKGISPAELDAIKKTLRDQMATDPGLTDLVKTATGHLPTPPEDE
jgi:hypothetical protein